MTTPNWFWWLETRRANSLAIAAGPAERRSYLTCWVALTIYIYCLAAFIADITSINTLAFGVFYVPLVATAAWYKGRGTVWLLATLACAMVIVGMFIPSFDPDQSGLVMNRTLSICALLATAAFVWRSRFLQDQLHEQFSRTRDAESAKSEAIASLRREVRPRLQTMFGVLQYMAETSQNNHVKGFGLIRGTGRCLVMTVENLIDLLQLKEKHLRVEMIDLGMVLSQIVESYQADIQASKLTLTLDTSRGIDAFVLTNPWALRRILENQLGEAINNSGSDDQIVIRTFVEHGQAVVSITKSSEQSSSVSHFDNEFHASSPLFATNHAFNQRLALAMNARLIYDNSVIAGSAARLILPVPCPQSKRSASEISP